MSVNDLFFCNVIKGTKSNNFHFKKKWAQFDNPTKK